MKNVLVTGANGFIGLALCNRLVANGFSVCAAIRRGKAGSLPTSVRRVEISAVDKKTDWSLALEKVEVVVHLAARVHRMKNRAKEPFTAFEEVNVQGTERLARSALEAGVKRFVFLSSVKVNGGENSKTYIESEKPHPIDSYAISKLLAEKRLIKLAVESEMELTILRPPLVYGPGVKANFLGLIKFIEKQLPLPFGSIYNRRSFIYIENLVDAIITCIQNPASVGKTYFVSDGQDVSTPVLVHMLSEALGVKNRLFPCPLLLLYIGGRLLCGVGPAVDPLIGSLTVDISRITRELNWRPPFTLKEGLGKTAKWYKRVS